MPRHASPAVSTTMSGTSQAGRRRPIAAAATAPSCSATPCREPQKRASPLEASPRGSSLLTPEPAQKRRTMRGGGGDDGGSCSSGVHVSVPPKTDEEKNNVGGDPSPDTVGTPGSNTAHLLLQLRRDCLEQQKRQRQQQHQYPKPLRVDRSAVSFGVQDAGSPLRGSGGAEASPGDAAAGAFAILDQRMYKNPFSGGNPRPTTGRGKGRGGGAAVASSFPAIGGNRQGQCDSTTERVFTGRDVNLTNASLRGPVKLGRSGNEGCTCIKSKCLKLYCQCFARQSMCTQACRCENCHNSVQHDAERQVAVTELLRRSPNAFGAKFTTEVHPAAGGTTTSSAVVHSNGCGCSKSACLKRYCECFNVGIACSDKCRCRNCKNKAASVRARTGPGIGAGGGDPCVRTVDTMSSTTLHPPTTAVNTNDMSRAGAGDLPGISAKRPRTTVMKRHPQDRAGTEAEGFQSSQMPRN